MPRRYAPKSRRPKRYGTKKYNRRFKRKRFARNSVNQLSMRAPLASRLLRVKLPWVETENLSLSNTVATSICFQGNALCPTTASGLSNNNIPAAGDTIASGAIEYSNFYDRYTINGSSINIEILNRAVNSPADPNITVQSGVVRAALLAVPFTTGQTADTWQQVRTQLDSYSYEQLLAWPYAKWRMLGANTGGASRLVFKMFRKTKAMCGIKDLRDTDHYTSRMPDNGASMAGGLGVGNPSAGFMYYLRLFPESASGASNNQSVAITTRMSLYTTMFQREFNPIRTLTA